MNIAYYIPIFLLLLIIFITERNKKIILKNLIKNKRQENKKDMIELAKRFIEKECIIYTFNSQIDGILKEVSDGAVLIEKAGVLEAVNIDFIVRIREYPKNKNGKKKSVVLD